MIHAVKSGKITNWTRNEDSLTSSIIGSLLYLPSELMWSILRNSCFDGEYLPTHSGTLIDYDFWPKWDSSGTNNSRYVEPDVFLDFQDFSLIIEAKRWDSCKMHDISQWRREITSWHNEYQREVTSQKRIFFIALGWSGENNCKSEEINNIPIFKCKWTSLLEQVIDSYKRICLAEGITSHAKSLEFILGDVIDLFSFHGYILTPPLQYLDSLFADQYKISSSSLDFFFSLPNRHECISHPTTD